MKGIAWTYMDMDKQKHTNENIFTLFLTKSLSGMKTEWKTSPVKKKLYNHDCLSPGQNLLSFLKCMSGTISF